MTKFLLLTSTPNLAAMLGLHHRELKLLVALSLKVNFIFYQSLINNLDQSKLKPRLRSASPGQNN
jgi:hypothetical protein